MPPKKKKKTKEEEAEELRIQEERLKAIKLKEDAEKMKYEIVDHPSGVK